MNEKTTTEETPKTSPVVDFLKRNKVQIAIAAALAVATVTVAYFATQDVDAEDVLEIESAG